MRGEGLVNERSWLTGVAVSSAIVGQLRPTSAQAKTIIHRVCETSSSCIMMRAAGRVRVALPSGRRLCGSVSEHWAPAAAVTAYMTPGRGADLFIPLTESVVLTPTLLAELLAPWWEPIEHSSLPGQPEVCAFNLTDANDAQLAIQHLRDRVHVGEVVTGVSCPWMPQSSEAACVDPGILEDDLSLSALSVP
mmetsp:Transcript_78514/g.209790  ORF Transcript_78514/g.209790 Transcript_78514/m.209790 type:complete len:192 (+) Transcript_78514:628-1203(+)